jgi:hypothetical protein
MEIHILRVFLAALGAFVAYMTMGFALFAALPAMKIEFQKYPNVYREEKDLMKLMPMGMAAIFVSIMAVAMLYALMYRGGPWLLWGLHLGALIGVFALGTFVIHNHVNLRIGWKLTALQGIAYFCQWIVVGVVISWIYQPS